MATYNVTYERQGRTDYVIVLAKDSIDAERQVRRMFPGASYYFALYVGE